MKNILKNVVLVFISFVIFFEFVAFISPENNAINVNEKGFTFFDKNINESVYFIGDSYASTNYAEEGYPLIFQNYFQSRGWNFIDLSRAGSELSNHKPILDSIGKLNPKLIVYFYNISDIVSLNDELLILNERNVILGQDDNKKEKSFNIIKYAYNKSASLLLFKKCAHHISLILTDRFLPGTPAYFFPKETLKQKRKLKGIFDSIHAQNLLIVVNTPFNTGKKPFEWEQYKVFKDISKKSEYTLIQTVDIVSDSKYSISWRNGHPNQEAIKIIADSLIQKFKEIK
jgi:hypothetical protein